MLENSFFSKPNLCGIDYSRLDFFLGSQSFMARSHYTIGSHTPSVKFRLAENGVSHHISHLVGNDSVIDKTKFHSTTKTMQCISYQHAAWPRHSWEEYTRNHLKSCLRVRFMRHYVASIFCMCEILYALWSASKKK